MNALFFIGILAVLTFSYIGYAWERGQRKRAQKEAWEAFEDHQAELMAHQLTRKRLAQARDEVSELTKKASAQQAQIRQLEYTNKTLNNWNRGA